MVKTITIYLLAVVTLSLVTFAVYGWDKRQAQRHGWRTPEKTLHLLSLLGGWPGAIFAQQIFRHKTQKLSFQVAFWITIGLHLAAVVMVAWP